MGGGLADRLVPLQNGPRAKLGRNIPKKGPSSKRIPDRFPMSLRVSRGQSTRVGYLWTAQPKSRLVQSSSGPQAPWREPGGLGGWGGEGRGWGHVCSGFGGFFFFF